MQPLEKLHENAELMHFYDLLLLLYLQKYPSALENQQLEIAWTAVVGTGVWLSQPQGLGQSPACAPCAAAPGWNCGPVPTAGLHMAEESQRERGNLGALIPSAHPPHFYSSAASSNNI